MEIDSQQLQSSFCRPSGVEAKADCQRSASPDNLVQGVGGREVRDIKRWKWAEQNGDGVANRVDQAWEGERFGMQMCTSDQGGIGLTHSGCWGLPKGKGTNIPWRPPADKSSLKNKAEAVLVPLHHHTG